MKPPLERRNAVPKPEIGEHLELDVDAVIAAAHAKPRGSMVIENLSAKESERFWAALKH
jgi:hypothetical protein